MLLHNYSGNSIRKAKTDKKDAVRSAQYALDRWLDLREYIPDDEIRRSLKLLNRQYTTLCKVKTMLNNNFISLVDQSFSGVNKLFTSPQRSSDGHFKWVDFIVKFPHCDCVHKISRSAFKDNIIIGVIRMDNTITPTAKRMLYTTIPKHSFRRFQTVIT